MPLYFIIIFLFGLLVYGVLVFVAILLGQGNTLLSLIKTVSRTPFLKKVLAKYQTTAFMRVQNPWTIVIKQIKTISMALFLQVCIFLFDALTIASLFYGLGVSISFIAVVTTYILTRIVSTLPVSPGALVLYEASMTFIFVGFGVPLATAAVVTILYRVLSFWIPMPIGFLLYRKLLLAKQ